MNYILVLLTLTSIATAVTYTCTMSNCGTCEDHGLECTGCSSGFLLKADKSGCSGL